MPAEEQKLALFVDDILIFLSSPRVSLPALMSLLEEYGSYSGYKLNEQKTCIINIHYNSISIFAPVIKWVGIRDP
jgi:hypothetical protein